MIDPAALRIGRAVIESLDSGEADCGGTHRARLEGHVERVSGKALGLRCEACRADHEDLGVRSRVGKFAGSVAGGGNDNSRWIGDHRTDRHLTTHSRRPSLREGGGHCGRGWKRHDAV